MSERRRVPRVAALILLATLLVLGVVWGPEIYYSVRYRQFESVTLPNGDGTVRFVVHWSEKRTDSVMHTDGTNWTGSLGTAPLAIKAEGAESTYWLLFPGTKSALRSGELPWIETSGRAPTEPEWRTLIEQRRLDYPDLDWDSRKEQWQEWAKEQFSTEKPKITPVIPGAASSGDASGG